MAISWKWLARANARAVFMCSLVGFVVVCAWWTWKEVAPRQMAGLVYGSGRPERRRTGLGITSFLQAQLSLDWAHFTGDPFSYALRATRRSPVRRPTRPVVTTTTNNNVSRPSKTRTISLVYKGMMVRPDGRTVAIIEDKGTKKVSFCPKGEVVQGFEIGEIGLKKVTVVAPDGAVVPLELGEAGVFKESDNDS